MLWDVINEKTDPASWKFHDVVKHLLDRGYRNVGKGSYSMALAKGSTVVRVNYQVDRCSAAYTKYCMENWKSDRHLPRVYRVVDYSGGQIVVMERLHRIEWSDEFADIQNFFLYLESKYEEPLIRLNNKALERAREFAEEHQTLVNSIDRVIEAMREHRCKYDLSTNNVMIRPSDGVLVLSDPVAPALK